MEQAIAIEAIPFSLRHRGLQNVGCETRRSKRPWPSASMGAAEGAVSRRPDALPGAQGSTGGGQLKKPLAIAIVSLLVGACTAAPTTTSAPTTVPTVAGEATPGPTGPAFSLLKPGILTVATDVSYPPWFIIVPGVMGAPDTATGVDGDLVNAFAAEHGLKVELLQTDFASMLLAVQQNQADLATGLSYNPDRSKLMYYTAAVGSSPTVMYTLTSFDYTGPDSLIGKRIGTGNGYWQVEALNQWQPGIELELFPNNVTGNQALLNGQIDAWTSDVTSLDNEPFRSNLDKVTAHALEAGDFGFTEDQILSPVYNAVACGNGELAMALDATLQRLQDSGEWATILARYLSGPGLVSLGVTPPAQGCEA
jgi:ABC-type amino acid transport substrate-binding protein